MKKTLFFKLMSLYLVFANNVFSFENGQKVCMVGNSITHTGRYFGNIVNFYATRYPDKYIEFYNCGIGGDNATKILKRLDKDILSKNPDWITLKTGMNDSNVFTDSISQNKAFDLYKETYSKILDRFKQNKLKVILICPSIYDETLKGVEIPSMIGRNNLIHRFAQFDIEMAKKYGYQYVDFWTPLQNINSEKQKKDSTFTIVGKDRVHPKEPGHLIMTYTFLKVIGTSSVISSICIDAKNKKQVLVDNGNITNLKFSGDEIAFDFLANSLPYIVPDSAKKALQYVPFMAELNNEKFMVNNLDQGLYDLFIDKQLVGTYSSVELETGVNLADNSKTPQYKQAVDVCKAGDKYRNKCTDRQNISYVEYNYLQPKGLVNDVTAAKAFIAEQLKSKLIKMNYASFYIDNIDNVKVIEKEISSLREGIYKINKPVVHKYKLVKHL